MSKERVDILILFALFVFWMFVVEVVNIVVLTDIKNKIKVIERRLSSLVYSPEKRLD